MIDNGMRLGESNRYRKLLESIGEGGDNE